MKDKILDFENRLLEDRNRLNQLMREYEGEDIPLLRNKLFQMENEIKHMEIQLNGLRQQLNQNAVLPTADVAAAAVTGPVKQTQRPYEKIVSTYQNQSQQTYQKDMPKPEKKDIENTFGKVIMGVAASVLIFISLILFSTLVVPYLTDTVKMVLTYVISILFLGTGLVMLQISKKTTFWLAISGCGAGGIYISLLLTNLYFKRIDDIALFVLVGIWAVVMCCLSKLRNHLFKIIGYIGIVVSVCFGTGFCMDSENEAKFIALVVFFLITSGVFFITHFEGTFVKLRLYHIFNLISIFVLYWGCEYLFAEGLQLVPVFLIVLLGGYLTSVFCSDWEKSYFGAGFVVCCYVLLFNMFLGQLGMDDLPECLCIYGVAFFISVIAQLKKPDSYGQQLFIQIIMIFVGHTILWNEQIMEYSYYLLMVLPLLWAGFALNHSIYKVAAFITCFLIGSCCTVNVINVIAFLIIVAVWFVMLYFMKEQYSLWNKLGLYILLLQFLVTDFPEILENLTNDWDVIRVTLLAVLVAVQLWMMKSPFSKNLKTGEPEKNYLVYGVNSLVMIYSIVVLNFCDSTGSHILAILLTVVVFMANTKKFMDTGKMLHGFYVGFKLTVMIIAILGSFDAVNYVISISCFVVALISIVIGFYGRYKALRLYGLILSMISVFKLVVIDTQYSNTLGNALSFLICGMICFAISMLYNYLDKRISKEISGDESNGLKM